MSVSPVSPSVSSGGPPYVFGNVAAASPAMRGVLEQLARVAPTDLSVLLVGETGTGKERIAQAIHRASPRADRPFVVVDCGAIPESLAEAALFGHEKGAFTGADKARVSPFLEAGSGTIFLDELGELPVALQTKLLRVLAERRVKAVGSNVWQPVGCRIVAATRRDLTQAVSDGAFRSDLFFRIAQVRVALPPLRERLLDVPLLVTTMLDELGAKDASWRVSPETLERLMRYPWPGNVRELRNAVEVALALAADGPIEIDRYVCGPSDDVRRDEAPETYHDAKRRALELFERSYFSSLVARHGANVSRLARLTGLARPHVRRYLRAHGLLSSQIFSNQ